MREDRTPRLRDVGEDGLVAGLLARFAAEPPAHGGRVLVGPGDDAAVLDVAGSSVVVSTDTLVEGQDFRRDWSSAEDVGVKLAAQNFADLAAMGAVPLALLVSLAAPGDLPATWADGLADGLARECRRAGASVVGGDVSAAREVVLTATALGVLSRPAVLRAGACVGDVVVLAGTPGRSAAGLALLEAGVSGADAVLEGLRTDHRAPRPPYAAGPAAAAAGATALIDTSDGLLRDADRVARASAVVLDLDSTALGPGPDLLHAAEVLGRPGAALSWVLSGGEDHALLACLPPAVAPPQGFLVIGRVVAGSAPGVLVDGERWGGPHGWLHFTAGTQDGRPRQGPAVEVRGEQVSG